MTIKILLDAVTGLTWALKLVQVGDKYGAGDKLVNDSKESFVEFYDTRYPHTPLGQFVSRYYSSTLLETSADKGLNLYGGVPSWVVSSAAMNAAKEWLVSVFASPPVMPKEQLLTELRRAVKRQAREQGGLKLDAPFADGNWRVELLADGDSTKYGAYAREARGGDGTIADLEAWELTGLLCS